MAQTAHLYLKTQQGVRGPFTAFRLHEMVRAGRIGEDTQVSPDGVRWLNARRIRGLFAPARESESPGVVRPAVPMPAERPELRDIAHRLERAARPLSAVFHPAVACGVLASFLLAGFAFYQLGRWIAPQAAIVSLAAAALLPAALLACAAGEATGNLLIRLLTRLADAERRCLALHLPWSRVPRHWPDYLRNWLYGGNWLRSADREEILPYVRAFITGSGPQSIEAELDLWTELLSNASGSSGQIEVGHAVRELAVLDRLPEWIRDVEPGTDLPALERRLGRVARDWASCLLRRAAQRIPESVGSKAAVEDVTFEFHYCTLRAGPEALLVLIRPKARRASKRRPAAAA